MIITKTLYVDNRKDWRSWLSRNWNKEKEIWLIYYKKSSGKKRISYADAIEEALCFGWIDSTAKAVDDEKYAQRFTPRRKSSQLSQLNRERVRRLILEKRMTRAGLAAINHVFDKDNDDPSEFMIAPDILKALKKDKKVWTNFQGFPSHYQRVRISSIEHVRKRSKEEFEKRLNYFIKMTSENKRFGQLQ